MRSKLPFIFQLAALIVKQAWQSGYRFVLHLLGNLFFECKFVHTNRATCDPVILVLLKNGHFLELNKYQVSLIKFVCSIGLELVFSNSKAAQFE